MPSNPTHPSPASHQSALEVADETCDHCGAVLVDGWRHERLCRSPEELAREPKPYPLWEQVRDKDVQIAQLTADRDSLARRLAEKTAECEAVYVQAENYTLENGKLIEERDAAREEALAARARHQAAATTVKRLTSERDKAEGHAADFLAQADQFKIERDAAVAERDALERAYRTEHGGLLKDALAQLIEAIRWETRAAVAEKERDDLKERLAYFVGSDEHRPGGLVATIYDRLDQASKVLGAKTLGDVAPAALALTTQRSALRAALVECCSLLDSLVDEVPGSVDWADRVDELRALAEEGG